MTHRNMIYSALYILLIVVVVNGAPYSYLDNLSNLGGWNPFSSDSENETEEMPNDPVRRVVDESDKNVQAVNPDTPIQIDDFVEEFKNKVQIDKTSTSEKKEIVGVLKQLRTAVYDNSMKKVKVLYRGLWHVVDLGIVGSSQRKRSAENTEGVLTAITDIFASMNKWFWEFWGYTDEEEKQHVSLVLVTEYDSNDEDDNKTGKDKNEDKSGSGKDKDEVKEGIKDEVKDGIIKTEKSGDENDSNLSKDEDSNNNSHDKKENSGVLKPLVKLENKSNGNTGTKRYEGIESAMKSLLELSSSLGNKLKTREEVDKELKEAQDKNDVKNKYVIQVNAAKKLMKIRNDEREWTEAAALEKLNEMNKDFEKSDKNLMVKDITSLSMQPLYYVETYDKIIEMIDRLRESGVPEQDLSLARDSVFVQKLFSLTHSILQTPKKQYQAEIRKKHKQAAKKEKELQKDTREWREDEALSRLNEIDKKFDEAEDAEKSKMLKDLISLCMQPLYKIETYDKIHKVIEKLKKGGKASEKDLKMAETALTRNLRFAYMNSILEKSNMQLYQNYKLQSQKAKGKREKQNDTRKFTEEEALKEIEDMNTNFDSKDLSRMTRDITNLSMQPFYHVETYDKISDIIEKLKKKGVTDDALKPAIDSLAEEKAFSSHHDVSQKPQLSTKIKLHHLKHKYLATDKPLDAAQKQALFKKLQKLREQGRKDFTQDGSDLVKALMGDESALDPRQVSELYQYVIRNQNVSGNDQNFDDSVSYWLNSDCVMFYQ